MGRRRLTCLLLALACLVHRVRPDDTTVAPVNTKATTLAAGATAPAAPATTAPSQSTTAPQPPATEKHSTRAPPSTAAPTTAAPTPAPTTVKVTTLAPVVASTAKPSTPSTRGGGAVATSIITTVSKSDGNPTTAGPKGASHSSQPPPVATTVMGSAPLQTVGITTAGVPIQTTPPRLSPSVTVAQVPGATGTAGTTRSAGTPVVPVPVVTAKGTPSIDPTTKHDSKVAGTTAVVTGKSSPAKNLGPTGSTAPPPMTPHSLGGTSEVPTAPVTAAKSSQDPLLVRTTQWKVQSTGARSTIPPTTMAHTATTTVPLPRVFSYSLNKGHQSEEEKELVGLCQQLMGSLEDGNCTVSFRHHNGKVLFDNVEITGKVKTTIVSQLFEDITKKPTDNRTLITILASCGALLIMIIILAVCASHHRKPYSENQQHLTEELQTVENGYHDNPTLEVMEVGADMQEKKPPLGLMNNGGGDFNDSWIVPMDNLLKEDGPDEEDTHL